MKFHELLNQYMTTLHCTGNELSARCGLSASVISRYRSGEREPQSDSDSLAALANALADLAKEQGMDQLSAANILSAFQNALLSKSKEYDLFLYHFNLLYDKAHLNMKDIATFTNFDPSSLYRIKSGERRTTDLPSLCDKLTKYVISTHTSEEKKEMIADLMELEPAMTDTSDSYYQAVFHWLLPNAKNEPSADQNKHTKAADISQLLTKFDEFDLEDFIRVIHFDKLKVPTLPLHLPATKNYFGIAKMREGELDFFKMTVTSRSGEPIFMCSDMPMLDMAGSNDFNKKWMFAIACAIKKGLHLNMVHSLNRPFEELLLGLEAWIPIYMTGQISPFYLPKETNPVYHHLNYVSGVAALCGESIEGSPLDGKYTLTNNKEDVVYYQKKAKHILSHAKPLMEIFDLTRKKEYEDFLKKDAQMIGERKNILSSLPIYTMSPELLERILRANQIRSEDAQMIRDYHRFEVTRMQQKLASCIITDELALPAEDTYDQHPMYVSLSGCFYDTPVLYPYEDMLAHAAETRAFADTHANYTFLQNDSSAFRNIQIEIVKDRYVVISKIKSPSIHFVIEHPKLVHALQNFTVPVIS